MGSGTGDGGDGAQGITLRPWTLPLAEDMDVAEGKAAGPGQEWVFFGDVDATVFMRQLGAALTFYLRASRRKRERGSAVLLWTWGAALLVLMLWVLAFREVYPVKAVDKATGNVDYGVQSLPPLSTGHGQGGVFRLHGRRMPHLLLYAPKNVQAVEDLVHKWIVPQTHGLTTQGCKDAEDINDKYEENLFETWAALVFDLTDEQMETEQFIAPGNGTESENSTVRYTVRINPNPSKHWAVPTSEVDVRVKANVRSSTERYVTSGFLTLTNLVDDYMASLTGGTRIDARVQRFNRDATANGGADNTETTDSHHEMKRWMMVRFSAAPVLFVILFLFMWNGLHTAVDESESLLRPVLLARGFLSCAYWMAHLINTAALACCVLLPVVCAVCYGFHLFSLCELAPEIVLNLIGGFAVAAFCLFLTHTMPRGHKGVASIGAITVVIILIGNLLARSSVILASWKVFLSFCPPIGLAIAQFTLHSQLHLHSSSVDWGEGDAGKELPSLASTLIILALDIALYTCLAVLFPWPWQPMLQRFDRWCHPCCCYCERTVCPAWITCWNCCGLCGANTSNTDGDRATTSLEAADALRKSVNSAGRSALLDSQPRTPDGRASSTDMPATIHVQPGELLGIVHCHEGSASRLAGAARVPAPPLQVQPYRPPLGPHYVSPWWGLRTAQPWILRHPMPVTGVALRHMRLSSHMTPTDHLEYCLGVAEPRTEQERWQKRSEEDNNADKNDDERKRARQVDAMLELWDLTNVRDVASQDLTADQARLLTLAMAFAGNVAVVVLERPLAGNITPQTQRLICAIVKQQQRELGRTVIWVAQDTEEAVDLCHRVIVTDGLERRPVRIISPAALEEVAAAGVAAAANSSAFPQRYTAATTTDHDQDSVQDVGQQLRSGHANGHGLPMHGSEHGFGDGSQGDELDNATVLARVQPSPTDVQLARERGDQLSATYGVEGLTDWSRIKAVWERRSHIQMRSHGRWVFQVLIPLSCMFIAGMAIAFMRTKLVNDKNVEDISLAYPPDQFTAVAALTQTQYDSYVAQAGLSNTVYVGTSIEDVQEYVVDVAEGTDDDDSTLALLPTDADVAFGEGGNGNYTVVFNASAPQALPSLVAVLDSAAISNNSQKHTVTIEVTNTPLKKSRLGKQVAPGAVVILCMAAGAACYLGTIARGLVRERESGSKALQLSAGASIGSFWTGTTLFDMLLCAKWSMTMTVIFACTDPGTFRDDLENFGLVYLTIFSMFFAWLPRAYLFSRLFSRAEWVRETFVLGTLLLNVALIPIIMYYLTHEGAGSSGAEVCKLVFTILEPGLGAALSLLTIKDWMGLERLSSASSSASLINYSNMGQYVFILMLQGCMWYLILWLFEFKLVDRSTYLRVDESESDMRVSVGKVSQTDDALDNALSPKEYVDFMAKLRGLNQEDPKAQERIVAAMLRVLRLDPATEGVKSCGLLDAVARRKVTIAAALIGGPRVVDLGDDPTAGLPPREADYVWEAIRCLTSQPELDDEQGRGPTV